jgi:uroporphyrinogen decarboxylase
VLDPYQGYLAGQLTCLDLICEAVGVDAPVIQTIFSPLAQAKNLAGGQVLLAHIRQFPEAVHAGLQIIAESTRLFIDAAMKTGISGIFYAVQHANYHLLSEVEYQDFGARFDQAVLESVRDCPCNLLHLHGENIMFNKFVDYPIQVINWHDQDTPPSLTEASQRTTATLCGGLQREKTMVLGTPEQVLAEAHDSILAMKGKKFILGTGCVLPITAPRVNILAARQSVEMTAGE